jgi:hypothetical protein
MYYCGGNNVCASTIGKKKRNGWWYICVDITDVIMSDLIFVLSARLTFGTCINCPLYSAKD